MIIDKIIKTKISLKNIEHYSAFFDNLKLKDIIDVDPNLHLQRGSNIKINVQCDICSIQRYIKYQAYYNNINSCLEYPIYTCDKCSHIKIKEFNKNKYGVEYHTQHPDRKDKVKKTLLERYGVDSYSKTDEFKEKVFKTKLERYGYENYNNRVKFNQTILERYGVDSYSKTDEFKNKVRLTNLERYGVDNPMKVNSIKEKIKLTNLEKYGFEYSSQSTKTKEKSKISNLQKYGVDSYTKTNEFIVKSISTNLKKYGVDNFIKSEQYRKDNLKIANNDDYIKYLGNNISEFSCNKGHTFKIHIDNYHGRIRYNSALCTVCYPIGDSKSIKEKELLEYIKSISSEEIISSYRDILEIDIYLPDLKLGFEFNGLYWHSELFKDKNYHLNKTEYFKLKGIRIIHIWEDDWDNRKDIIKSQINNLLGSSKSIFARKCYTKEIKDSKIVSKFLNDNHIQGKVNSSLKLGLYHTVTQSNGTTNEELVSLMTFDHNEGRKKMELGGWNLNRFCNKLNTNVIGGASKLLRYFIKNYDVKRIVSYADKDWSLGNLYEVLGFTNIGGNGPDYKYIIDNQRVHKSRYKKSKLKTELTESQEMSKREIYKIYDCGKLKFEKKIN
jgi:hypothetical protein